ncbi:MAG: UDP-N-acetylmuramoyl-L-alanyl-D-glutamate--2,6-diaminopimelate ligase [Myxococcota bacterium]|jgi:UDP-N-acetylmuramoyl-L-alanyl-D-glutamate--2,6-diaminopimelate ligase
MRLSPLLAAVPSELSPQTFPADIAPNDTVIRGIGYDSRTVAPGDLFVALRGADQDGHDYLAEALRAGASALLVEDRSRLPADIGVPVIVVADARRALAHVARSFYGNPAAELSLVGITGTNGKTSTAYLVESILGHAGLSVGLIGTVVVRFGAESARATNTTPESLDLQKILRAMRTQSVDSVVMEVSSHGLELGRVEGCNFAVAGFTNLSQDHLDFHGDMEHYRQSKLRLFETYLDPKGTAVVNIDDPASDAILEITRRRGAKTLTTSQRADSAAEIRILEAECGIDGSHGRIRLGGQSLDFSLPLLGDFNLENLGVACGIAIALEIPIEAILEGVAECPQVPGRMERIAAGPKAAPTVVVDYAHTPDAVEKLLAALAPLTSGRLITVFGCGGDRDRSKRPLMAREVARHSDRVVLTSDNPRTEDALGILREVEAGLAGLERRDDPSQAGAPASYTVVEDRATAIAGAVSEAEPGDTVVIAGKGHEDYQIVGREKRPFDDRREAARGLEVWTRA